jgi:hypothetical protein
MQDQEGPPLPPPKEPPPQFGRWKPSPDSKYLYNVALKFYYDQATGFYYGGEPPAWTQSPSIPDGALYKNMHPEKASGAYAVLVTHARCHASAPVSRGL